MSTRTLGSGSSRLDTGRWPRRFRVWRPWLVGLGLVALVAGLCWVVFFSSWLGVRGVEVHGATTTPAAEITRAAHVSPDTPLARVDLSAVRERVEAIPTVASAAVTRRWPHTVVVQVTDRRPVADVFQDGHWRLVDESGVAYVVAPRPDPDLPIVELEGSPRPETLPQVAAALRALPTELLAQTRRVRAASMDSITLLLNDGRTVRWGSAALSAQKATVLKALLHTKARTLDVTVPSHPAIR